jgi:tetratricopeptide (TPR) repeat protein
VQTTQIPVMNNLARALQNRGDTEAALALYSQILASKPDIAEVHFQVGRIFYGGNRFTKAVFHFKLAIQIKPNEPGIWNEYIPALLCNVDPDEIKAATKQLKKTKMDPKLTIRFQNKLINTANGLSVSIGTLSKTTLNSIQDHIVHKDFKSANAQALALVRKNPKNAVVTELLARTYDGLGQINDARKYFKLAISLDPKFYNAYVNQGKMEFESKDSKAALALFKEAIIVAPHGATGICHMANTMAQMGVATEARQILQNAKKLHLKGGQIHRALSEQYIRAGNYELAEKNFATAIKRETPTYIVYGEFGDALMHVNQVNLALKYYKMAHALDDSNPEIMHRLATAYREIGNFEKSLSYIESAIKRSPSTGRYLAFYSSTQKFTSDDPLIEKMVQVYADPKTAIADRTDLGFAISKAFEDTKQYDKVFGYLKSANDDMRARYPYDVNDFETEIDRVQDYFSDFKLINYKEMGQTDAHPIFVTGMPRSGTTLVEQIIASHSEVTGAGEVGYTGPAERRVLEKPDQSLISLKEVNDTHLETLGTDIWRYLQHLHPSSKRITDKSIQTYKRMGLLKAAMPNCKIIVVRRDPRDNLLSIYRNKFVDGTHLYAYDLSDLGVYYKQFVRIIDFWRQKMPEGFMEIQYEDLIDDPEKYARALIDYCDLDWENECLNFHKSKRQVKTLSVMQVRQPIYKSSVKAWQRYEDDLQPLFEALK